LVFTRLLLLLILLGALGHGPVAQAHDSRPAYLEINETAPGRYEVLWRTPISAGMPLPVMLVVAHPDQRRDATASDAEIPRRYAQHHRAIAERVYRPAS
jgi:hypothetical protein